MENVTVSTEQEMEEDDDDESHDQYHEYNHHQPSTTSTSSSALAVTIALPPPISPPTTSDKKPIHDSRKLFQRLWTDEDEIELLQGFLLYTSQRGSSHHNDTALFYHQIKSKFQIDFNKNQLVDKIRRLKKKYRNVLNKISSGKDFSFKTPHDQATFQISRKIWSNIGQISGSGVLLHDNSAFDQDEINLNPNNHYYPYHNPNPDINLNLVHSVMMLGNAGEKESTQSRKRLLPQSATMRIDEKPYEFLNDGSGLGSGTRLNLNMNKDHDCINNSTAPANVAANVNNNRDYENNCNNSSSNIPGLIEETVRSCVSPVLKELLGSSSSFMGLGWMNPIPIPIMPLSYSGLGGSSSTSGDAADEKWRKQQILELEVYAKRLELVQAQINAALEELRSIGGGGG